MLWLMYRYQDATAVPVMGSKLEFHLKSQGEKNSEMILRQVIVLQAFWFIPALDLTGSNNRRGPRNPGWLFVMFCFKKT